MPVIQKNQEPLMEFLTFTVIPYLQVHWIVHFYETRKAQPAAVLLATCR